MSSSALSNEVTPERLAYWQPIIKKWENSGQTQSKFCVSKGISYAKFVYWRAKLPKEESDVKPEFVPVQLKSKEAPLPIDDTLELCLPNGVRIKIPVTVNMTHLQALLPLLGVK